MTNKNVKEEEEEEKIQVAVAAALAMLKNVDEKEFNFNKKITKFIRNPYQEMIEYFELIRDHYLDKILSYSIKRKDIDAVTIKTMRHKFIRVNELIGEICVLGEEDDSPPTSYEEGKESKDDSSHAASKNEEELIFSFFDELDKLLSYFDIDKDDSNLLNEVNKQKSFNLDFEDGTIEEI